MATRHFHRGGDLGGRPRPAHGGSVTLADARVTRVQRELEWFDAGSGRVECLAEISNECVRGAPDVRSLPTSANYARRARPHTGVAMPGTTREWITIPVPGKERKQWQIDVTFLSSSWRCIYGQGCQGVLTEPAPELVHGCCSYGAHASDKKDKDKVEKLAKKLTDAEWQHRKIGLKKGVWARAGKDEWRTRLHDDACIFLNRTDFAAGPGCALHLHALNTGKHFSETKPTVCWQLPLRAVERDEEDESTTTVLTEFGRDGWGDGGEEFAWWCTEAKEAFTGAEPVYKSMETELRMMLGDAIYEEVAKYLDARFAAASTPLPHPAEVPVSLGRTRIRRP
jgi:hypothetical protein